MWAEGIPSALFLIFRKNHRLPVFDAAFELREAGEAEPFFPLPGS